MNQSFDLDRFDKYSKDQWIKEVSKELDDVNPLEKLSWQFEKDLDVLPIYFQEDLKQSGIPGLSGKPSECMNLFWCKLPLKERELEALQSISEFYDGLYIDNVQVSDQDNKLLEKIPTKQIVILSNENIALVERLVSGNEEVRGNLGYQPFLFENYYKDSFEEEILAIHNRRSGELEKFSIITIPGNQLIGHGASLIQELGVGLSILVECYDRLQSADISNMDIVREIDWVTSIGQDFFHETAKLNAIQKLVMLVQQSFGFDPVGIKVHGQSSFRYKTTLEDTNNIVRNTVEAAAAMIGGCQTMCMSAHNLGDPGFNGMRTALNVGNILKKESFLDRVNNPTSGAYYLEVLSDKIGSAAWSFFQEIEGQGGFSKAFQSGWISSHIDQSRSSQMTMMSEGSLNLIGVNKYPTKKVGSSPDYNEAFRLAKKYEEEI